MKPYLQTPLLTKDELIKRFKEINALGWVENKRGKNDGAVGNTLEDLLGIPENNLPIPNAAEWELKAQRSNTTSLVTLCHLEPSPRAAKLVSNLLLPNYGWKHAQAGNKYPLNEKSFRQTLNGVSVTDRGFSIRINNEERKIEITFDSKNVSENHKEWLKSVADRTGLGPLPVTPYWGFNDLYLKIGTKLTNCFFVKADTKKENGKEYFYYNSVLMLKTVNMQCFIESIKQGLIYVDFDARTGHNHGTKFRIRYNNIPKLYQSVTKII